MKNNIVIMAWRDIWHPEKGGADIYIQRVATYLKNRGYSVIYLTAMYKGAKKEEVRDGIKYIRMGNPISIYLILPLYFVFKLKDSTKLLIENFNAVPFNIPIYFDSNITVIHHLQDEEWKLKYGKFLGKIFHHIFTHMLVGNYRREKYLVTVSPSSRAELIGKGFAPNNISIVYNGINTKVNAKAEKDNSVIKILSHGRMPRTKHIDKAIRLVNYTVKKLGIRNIVLKISGRGADEDRLKGLVKKYQLENYVKFLGFVSDRERARLFEEAHLHVQFSRKEGWGTTVLEAASKRTPTICFPVQGLRDSVKDSTGYLVRGSLRKTWKQAIHDIQTNSKNYVSKQDAGVMWSSQFIWRNQMEHFGEIVRKALVKY